MRMNNCWALICIIMGGLSSANVTVHADSAGLELGEYYFAKEVKPTLSWSGYASASQIYFQVRDGSTVELFHSEALAGGQVEANHTFNISSLDEASTYTARVELQDSGGGLLARLEEAFFIPPTPVWLDSTLGTEDILLPPWTAMTRLGNVIGCWDREYDFSGGAALPQQITSQGNDILAAPISLQTQVNGTTVSWSSTNWTVTNKTDTRVSVSALQSGGSNSMTTNYWIEYDGMAWFDVTIAASAGKQLDSLILEIPIKAEYATLLFGSPTQSFMTGSWPHWPGWDSGFVPTTQVSGPFTPYIWLGNDHQGFTWCAEAPKNWSNANSNDVIRLIPGADRMTLQVRIVDSPVSLDEAMKFSFGLQATPVKPMREREKIKACYYGDGVRVDRVLGALEYPAAGHLNPDEGAIHFWVRVNFDPNETLSDFISAGAYNKTLLHVNYADESQIGFYWNGPNRTMRTYFRDGPYTDNIYLLNFDVPSPTWQRDERHLLSLSWGDEVGVYFDGVRVGGRSYSGLLDSDLTTATIRIASAFALDAVKVTNTAYTGGEVTAEQDGNTTLFDTFSNPSGPSHLEPEHSATDALGKLSGEYSFTDDGLYGRELIQSEFLSELDLYARDGVGVTWIHQVWTTSQGAPRPYDMKDRLIHLAQGAHDAGLKLIVYLGFQIGDNIDVYDYYKDEILTEPVGAPYNAGTHNAYTCSYACEQYANYMIYYLNETLEDTGIDGFYLDGTFTPQGETNQSHGAGFIDRSGTLQKSYQIRKYRDWMKRMKTILHSHKPDGWIDMHDSNAIWTPTNSFGDSIWNGEQYTALSGRYGKDIRQVLPPDTFRASFLGVQYGFPTDVLDYYAPQHSIARAAVHGIPVRFHEFRDLELLKEELGGDLTWHPYYENSGSLTHDGGEDVYASFYQAPQGDVILIASNLGTTTQTVTFQLDNASLDLPERMNATDMVSEERVEFENFTFQLELEEWLAHYIHISPPPPAKTPDWWLMHAE